MKRSTRLSREFEDPSSQSDVSDLPPYVSESLEHDVSDPLEPDANDLLVAEEGHLARNTPDATSSGYARRARIASIGVGLTGIVTFAFFSISAQVLSAVDYKQIAVLWSVMFVVATVIYRPIEQLLTRTIAERQALGVHYGSSIIRIALIQAFFACAFLVLALLFKGPIKDDLFNGSQTLYYVLITGILTYTVSYFARGWLAGHQRSGLYGCLMLIESCARCMFPIVVAIGIAEGQSFVALGIAAAPFVSLIVIPFAIRGKKFASIDAHNEILGKELTTRADCLNDQIPRVGNHEAETQEPANQSHFKIADRSDRPRSVNNSKKFRDPAKFALAALLILFAEQVLLNAAVLTVNSTSKDLAMAGFVFNALLIARAPLQLFQAIQGSLLPHLTYLQSKSNFAEFNKSVFKTVRVISLLALVVIVGLLLIGPETMNIIFGNQFEYGRFGLVLVGTGMSAHLIAGTLNQAALAQNKSFQAAAIWLVAATLFVLWMFFSPINDQLLRAEAGYLVSTSLLGSLLFLLSRRLRRAARQQIIEST